MSGQPAARLGDMHTCPMVDPGPKPHVGGPILPSCAATVLIGGQPAARVGDKLTCMGPPDTIAKGSATVFIGGRPAARMGDSTAHGGVIVAGCPTVIIGDGGGGGPPATMSEVEARMEAATAMVKVCREEDLPLPASPYSDADKLAIAQNGLQEKYVVRLTKTQYAGDGHTVGPGKTYWTTTYTQLEHADKDVELLCQTVGVNRETNAEYSLLIIDTEAGQVAGMKTFVPTYEALGDFAAHHLENPIAHPELIPEVMNEAYSKKYADLRSKVPESFNPNNAADAAAFAKKQKLTDKEAELFRIRFQMEKRLGANEHYLGNGVTKNLSTKPGDAQLGAVETFTYDKNPQTLGALEKQGVVKRINLGK